VSLSTSSSLLAQTHQIMLYRLIL